MTTMAPTPAPLRAAALACALAAAAAAPPAAAEEPPRPPAEGTGPPGAARILPPDVERFTGDGRAERLLGIVRAAFRAASGLVEAYPVEPPDRSGRPAGPRDEPVPPDWPAGARGLVLCLRAGGAVRGCEGRMERAGESLGSSAAALAERLAAGRGPTRRRALAARERRPVRIEASFVVAAVPLDPALKRRDLVEAGIDLRAEGLLVEGDSGALFLPPGEARSLRAAARLARRAGVLRRGGAPARLLRLRLAAAGARDLLNP